MYTYIHEEFGHLFFFLPPEAGVAIGTQASPCPVTVDTDSNVLAKKAEIGWTRREDTPTSDSSAREGKHKKIFKNHQAVAPTIMSQRFFFFFL